MAEEKQETQKTLVAFVVGLLIGGMLVWAFSGPSADAPATQNKDEVDETTSEMDEDEEEATDTDEEMEVSSPVLEVGSGEIRVNDQPAGSSVNLDGAVYPINEGWVGVREYTNEDLGFLLGAVRFSESNNQVPTEIALLRPTTAGRDYAIVVYTEDGDSSFNLATDVQIDRVFGTFTAQ